MTAVVATDHFARNRWAVHALIVLASIWGVCGAEERLETFEVDPGWDGLNNRSTHFEAREVTQNFGYVEDGGEDGGAIGGSIMPDGQAAYYGKVIQDTSLDSVLSASGRMRVAPGAGNTLVGFFNSGTVNEWRTPNSLVLRVNGRGEFFHVHVEYATGKWRAGATVIGVHDFAADRVYPAEIPSEGWHDWSLRYDPQGNDGQGVITVTFDGTAASCPIPAAHRLDGAVFNRFGILNTIKSVDSPGSLWIAGLSINEEAQDLSGDPKWDSRMNRRSWISEDVRPRFNFGFSASQFAGGGQSGEFGGLFFRGDCRYPERLAYYGAPVEWMNLNSALRASGKISLRRGVTDSTTLFGFFHAKESVAVNPSQQFATPMNFLGFAIEGPSSEGFFTYPVYRFPGDRQGHAPYGASPAIYPDGATHDWSMLYQPAQDQTGASIALTLDDKTVVLPLTAEDVESGARFNRFGFVSPWIDGNGQIVYLDDIHYTFRQ